jgi:hypothetical protein
LQQIITGIGTLFGLFHLCELTRGGKDTIFTERRKRECGKPGVIHLIVMIQGSIVELSCIYKRGKETDERCGELGMGKDEISFAVGLFFALLHWDYSPGLASQGWEWNGMGCLRVFLF